MSLSRLTELAKEDCERKFTSIAHFLTPETLYEAFRSLRKDASAGVDQVTYADYATQAQENIQRLWERLKGQKYRAQPLRRIYIPKEDGSERPISIPALEDKIVQKATVRLLNAIYETDFLACSKGFRPGCGPHDALDEVDRILFREPISYVLELDISSYFDQPSQCPPQEPTFRSKVSSFSLPALSLRSAASVAGLSGKRYNFVRASRASAIVPLWMRS